MLAKMNKRVCRDCFEVLAFGNEALDVMIFHYGEGLAHVRLEEIETGIAKICKQQKTDDGRIVNFTFTAEIEELKDTFSTSRCECCNSQKAGERFWIEFLEI